MPVEDRLRSTAPDEARLSQHTGTIRADVLGTVVTRRRRRRWPAVALVAGLVAVLAFGSAVLVRDRGASDQRVYGSTTPDAAYRIRGAFSVGRTLFIGDHRVQLAEKVKSLYYTSAGVVVRTGSSASVDGPGPSHYTLVAPDGARRALGVTLGDQVPGTSPGSPLFAFAQSNGNDRWLLTLVDVRTGSEDATTTVDGAFTWAAWIAPPVSTDGTRVQVLLDRGWVEWDPAKGTVRDIARAAGATTPLASGGGHYVQERPGRVDVRDFSDGRIIFGHSVDPGDLVTLDHLSPGGGVVRYKESFAVYNAKKVLVSPPHGGVLHDLATGREFSLAAGPWGWTPEGRGLKVDQAQNLVTICSVRTQSCRTIEEQIPTGTVRLGGTQYGR